MSIQTSAFKLMPIGFQTNANMLFSNMLKKSYITQDNEENKSRLLFLDISFLFNHHKR